MLEAFSVEWIKIKRTKALAATFGAPLFVAFVALMIHLNHPEKLIESDSDPWILVFRITSLWGLLLSVLIISLVTYLVNGVEHKADSWKHVYALPTERWKLYAGKMLTCLMLSFISVLFLYMLLYIVSFALATLFPEIAFDSYNPHRKIALVFIKLCVTSFVVVQIQFLISKVIKNFMIPLGVGILSAFSVIALQQWKHIHLFPYAYSNIVVRDLLAKDVTFWQLEIILSLGIGFLVLIGGFIWNQKRDIS